MLLECGSGSSSALGSICTHMRTNEKKINEKIPKRIKIYVDAELQILQYGKL